MTPRGGRCASVFATTTAAITAARSGPRDGFPPNAARWRGCGCAPTATAPVAVEASTTPPVATPASTPRRGRRPPRRPGPSNPGSSTSRPLLPALRGTSPAVPRPGAPSGKGPCGTPLRSVPRRPTGTPLPAPPAVVAPRGGPGRAGTGSKGARHGRAAHPHIPHGHRGGHPHSPAPGRGEGADLRGGQRACHPRPVPGRPGRSAAHRRAARRPRCGGPRRGRRRAGGRA